MVELSLTWQMGVSGPSDAVVIETFLHRAARVINSELVNASKARIEQGYNVDIRITGNRHVLVDHGSVNEYLIKGLAVDLRPFLPWVDDQLKVSRVMTVVMRSINDPQPRRKRKPPKEHHLSGWDVNRGRCQLPRCAR